MRVIRFLIKKEFLQIFRNKGMLPIIFVMPVFQLLVLSFAATYTLKNVDFALVDQDQSQFSRELTSKFVATDYFELQSVTLNKNAAIAAMDKGDVKMILHVPTGFESALRNKETAPIQIMVDAVDGVTAGLIQAYSSSIVADFNQNKISNLHQISFVGNDSKPKLITVISQNWYNPNLDYMTYMVPGILVVLVTMIGLFLSGMNIVREQEIGTIEQLNVTPIKKYQFMIGKLLPFWIIGMVDLLIGFVLARFGFQIPFLGSLFTILVISGIYLVVIQALGLLISTITHTQQQAMFISWFIMVIFILMGGLFTPIESMPQWAQNLTLANPVSHFIKIMRMVLLKGAGWKEVYAMVIILVSMGTVLMAFSINQYKKTSAS